MDMIEKVRNLPKDWKGTVTDLAAVLETSRASVYRYQANNRIEPDLVRGNRRYFSKECVLRFVKNWYANPDRVGGA